MKVVGVIAEYNPFHNGHKYQIDQIRKMTGCDIIIVAMSGNFLQRGVPAIFDKWHRARWAVSNGADLVVELPVYFACQAADYFAQGGVSLLRSLYVDTLAFGVEEGTSQNFSQAAEVFMGEEETIRLSLNNTNRSLSYPDLINQVIKNELPEFPIDLSTPNNILGFSYAKQVFANDYSIDLLPIQRVGAGYHDQSLSSEGKIASATAIRQAIFHNDEYDQYLPNDIYKDLLALSPVAPRDLWAFLRYQLWRISSKELLEIYQMAPGMEVMFKKEALKSKSYPDFIKRIKSKHLTLNRVNRLLIYSLLEVKDLEIKEKLKLGPEYIRPLAFSQAGQEYLSQIKHDLTLPLISRVGQNEARLVDLDIRAGQLYQLIKPQLIRQQDFSRNPFRTIDNKAFD